MLHRRNSARFPPDVMLGVQAKEFNLGFNRPENLDSHGLRELKVCNRKIKYLPDLFDING